MSLKDYIRIVKRHLWWIVGWSLLIFLGFLFYEKTIKPVRYSGTASFRVVDTGVSRPVVDLDTSAAVKSRDVDSDVLIYGDNPDLREHKSRMGSQDVIVGAIKRYFALEAENPQKKLLDKYAWGQSPYPKFTSDNPSDESNVLEFKRSLKITENYSNNSFLVEVTSTNKYKVTWMLHAFVDAYVEMEEERVKRSAREVLKGNEDRYEATRKRFEGLEMSRELQRAKLEKQYGQGFGWREGTESKIDEKKSALLKISEINKVILQLKSEIQDFEVFEPDRWLIDDGEGHKIVELQNELYAKREVLQQELASLRVDFTDKHPKVVRKLAELNSLNDAFPRLAEEIIQKKLRSLKGN